MFTVALMFVMTALVFYYLLTRREDKYPPGPLSLPILGNLLQLAIKGSVSEFAEHYKKIYGNVFTFEFGGNKRVVLSGYETIHTLLVKNADYTSNRSINSMTQEIKKVASDTPGMFWAPFPHWKTLRSFTISTLREEGMGKSAMEPKIHEEIQQYLNHFIEPNLGTPFSLAVNLSKATSNITSQMLYGKRFDYDDKKNTDMILAIEELVALNVKVASMQNLPFASYLLKSTIESERFVSQDLIIPMVKQYIKEHKESLDRENPRDIIDKYLIHSETAKGERMRSFSEDNAMLYSLHFYIAGTETTATALKWAFLFMCLHPEVKEKVMKEIDERLGPDMCVTYKDRLEMPYTEAVMLETLRKGNVVSTALPHAANRDIVINGVLIPAGADLMLNMASVHYDETVFEEPEKFKPERYLTGDIALKKQRTIPFGIGRRLCPGESLARMEFFLFFVTILQRYDVRLPDGVRMTDDAQELILRCPKPYELIFTARH